MQFVFDNGCYKVARITGSHNNILSVRLSDNKCPIKIIPLPMKDKEISRIDNNEVLRQVIKGLSIANKELEKQYFVSEIQFLASDTNSPSVYRNLIYALIMCIDSGSEFIVT